MFIKPLARTPETHFTTPATATCHLPLAPSLQLITEISLCESVFLCKKSWIKYNTHLNIS